MAEISDTAVPGVINIVTLAIFLWVFTLLRIQPCLDRFYFQKWYLMGLRNSPAHSGQRVSNFVKFSLFLKSLNWMRDALRMPEAELIEHAGLDSVVYLRMFLMGIKFFAPIAFFALIILVPVNYTNNTVDSSSQLMFSNMDKMSISNIHGGSKRLWTHLVMAYAFSFWTCYVLFKEYNYVAQLRLQFLASRRRPEQFTVLARNIPPNPPESASESVEHFFLINHPDGYLLHQPVYDANKLAKLVEEKNKNEDLFDYYKLEQTRHPDKRLTTKTGFLRKKVDACDYYSKEIDRLEKEIAEEHERVMTNPKAIMPAAFISFRTRWGAAVCAQTLQSSINSNIWLTEGAADPCDVIWKNLTISYVNLICRRVVICVVFLWLTFFFLLLGVWLANLEGVEKSFQFLNEYISMPFIQGYLPGLALKLMLRLVDYILIKMSKFEGFTSHSALQRKVASRYYVFNFFNTFLGTILAGTVFHPLSIFSMIVSLLEGNEYGEMNIKRLAKEALFTIPVDVTFFINFVMLGWVGMAREVLMVGPLIKMIFKNTFTVKTEKDKEAAMDAGILEFSLLESGFQFHILLGLVYAVVSPIILPFILVTFAFSYLLYRHQIINVYHQEYESAAAFWPNVHRRIVTSVVISQVFLMGMMISKKATLTTPFLLLLPFLTILFYRFCKSRFEAAFTSYPLQAAIVDDTLEQSRHPNFDVRTFLAKAYVHPAFKQIDEQIDEEEEQIDEEEEQIDEKEEQIDEEEEQIDEEEEQIDEEEEQIDEEEEEDE